MKIKVIKQYIAGTCAALLLTITGIGMAASPAYAAQNVFQGCDGASDSTVCNNKTDDAKPMITAVINTILLILGIIAVLMIIIGGIRYTISGGDSGSVQSAKNTILYAVVGLVIAMLAFAIVNFVIARLK